MCGIAGLFSNGQRPVEALRRTVQTMNDALVHRGPDGEGLWIDEGCGVALGHRRLAVIDLTEAGAQPMISASGRYVVTYNGELYNFQALRAELEAGGRAPDWRGHSDTEVALAAIEAWGLEAALRRFNGQFALALWDRQQHSLSLARDRFGEKPLYYALRDGVLWFASELRPLRTALGLGEADVDLESLEWLFRVGHVPAPRCIVRGVSKLPPAHWLSVCAKDLVDGLARTRPYWIAREAALSAASAPFAGAEDDADEALAGALQRSVAMRLVADVPVGAMLSGGVDSAAVCAAAKNTRLKTFTVGFASAAHDESPAAAQMAAALGTEHTTLFVGGDELLAAVPKMAGVYDEPFADSSQIPTYLVSRALRSQVTVALSGDGGDELFGGYTRYSAGPRLWSALASIPRPVRSAAAIAVGAAGAGRLASLMTTATRGDAHDAAHARKALALLDARSESEVFERLTRHWPTGGNVSAFSGRLAAPTPDGPAGLDFARRMMLADTEAYLPDDILTKVDRASMAVSLEVRAPFLDPELFDLVWSLPTSFLISGGAGKRPLRRLLQKVAPQGHTERRKQGFAVPLDAMLRGPLRTWAGDLLARSQAPGTFYAPGKVRQAWEDHGAGRADNGYKLWPILMFEAWRDTLA